MKVSDVKFVVAEGNLSHGGQPPGVELLSTSLGGTSYDRYTVCWWACTPSLTRLVGLAPGCALLGSSLAGL